MDRSWDATLVLAPGKASVTAALRCLRLRCRDFATDASRCKTAARNSRLLARKPIGATLRRSYTWAANPVWFRQTHRINPEKNRHRTDTARA